MDEQFVQGVIGGVLNRHKNRTLDKNRIQTLMVEIAANIDIATQYTNVKGFKGVYCIRIRKRGGIYGQIYPFA